MGIKALWSRNKLSFALPSMFRSCFHTGQPRERTALVQFPHKAEGGWMAASRCVRCMQCLCCGFVLGRRGQLSRRSSIQVDEISCIRDHPRSLLSELQVMIPKVERNGVCI